MYGLNESILRLFLGEIQCSSPLPVAPTQAGGVTVTREDHDVNLDGLVLLIEGGPKQATDRNARGQTKRRRGTAVQLSEVIWFQRASEGARTRLLLKTFGDQDKCGRGGVIQLTDCAVADTFPAFAEELGADGFAFLYQRIKAGLPDGPILVRIEDRRIVGAIGPLALLDSTGTRMQPPQYFAVHPHYRRRGHGRALWRAAMAWGADNGAKYKVLQAAAGSASELLYLSEGLSTLGFVCSRALPQQPKPASAHPSGPR
jgi:GNAT superfamily N-acetyltransferase